jgi:hypothetical protein
MTIFLLSSLLLRLPTHWVIIAGGWINGYGKLHKFEAVAARSVWLGGSKPEIKVMVGYYIINYCKRGNCIHKSSTTAAVNLSAITLCSYCHEPVSSTTTVLWLSPCSETLSRWWFVISTLGSSSGPQQRNLRSTSWRRSSRWLQGEDTQSILASAQLVDGRNSITWILLPVIILVRHKRLWFVSRDKERFCQEGLLYFVSVCIILGWLCNVAHLNIFSLSDCRSSQQYVTVRLLTCTY